jgi:hypothetical protein
MLKELKELKELKRLKRLKGFKCPAPIPEVLASMNTPCNSVKTQ